MLLNGQYAVYEGKEYRASSEGYNGLCLYGDEEDAEKGFKWDGIIKRYRKNVRKDEVEDFYQKRLRGTYLGREFDILAEDEEHYFLLCCSGIDRDVQREFVQIERGVYEKKLKKSEVKNLRYKITSYTK